MHSVSPDTLEEFAVRNLCNSNSGPMCETSIFLMKKMPTIFYNILANREKVATGSLSSHNLNTTSAWINLSNLVNTPYD